MLLVTCCSYATTSEGLLKNASVRPTQRVAEGDVDVVTGTPEVHRAAAWAKSMSSSVGDEVSYYFS